MISLLHHSQIDTKKWDQVIARSMNASIFGYSWFLNRLYDDWQALVKGNYEVVMPLPGSGKWGFQWVSNPVPGVTLGMFSAAPLNKELVNDFFEKARRIYPYIFLPLNKLTPLDKGSPYIKEQYQSGLDLIQPIQTLKRSFAGELSALQPDQQSDPGFMQLQPNDLIQLIITSRKLKSDAWKRVVLRNVRLLLAHSIRYGYGKLWGIYSTQNNLSAGCLFLSGHQKTHLMFPVQTPEGYEEKALLRLINRFIVENAGRNRVLETDSRWYDKEGNPLLDFGGKLYRFPVFHYNRLPFLFPWLSRT